MATSIQKQINYWKESAERNWKTAQSLFILKHYDSCLFFCHLTLEKMIKALVVIRTKRLAPLQHDLAKLAILAGIKLDQEMILNLRTISQFNIAGRYDDAKLEFYKRCTRQYTQRYFKVTESIILWLRENYQNR